MHFDEISARAQRARDGGAETVVVLGLGFVGTAVSAALSRARHAGTPSFFVIGLERESADARTKLRAIEEGRPPTEAEDEKLSQAFREAAREPRTLCATFDVRVLALADVVVSCINLDLERAQGQTEELDCPTESYVALMRTIGRHLKPRALVCVESTLPLGLSDRVLYPALCAGALEAGRDVERDPPLYAYCYERVTPGPNYLDSVLHGPRAFAGIDERSADRTQVFLESFLDTRTHPLWRHKTLRACEMAKLLENAYRATNIAFVDEWARLAERSGVDLFDVVRSIRVRKGTHDNLMLPGLGVGGYCLTKDALLAAWGAEELLDVAAELPFARQAILTNERMPLRAAHWIDEHFGGDLSGRRAALFGVTYRAGVADTRSSPSETLARTLLAHGVHVSAFDPLVRQWSEIPQVELVSSAERALRGAQIAVVCLPDPRYRTELFELLLRDFGPGSIVIDPWDVFGDACVAALVARGVRVRVYGRGDVPEPAPRQA